MKLIGMSLVAVLVLNAYGLAYPEEPRQDAKNSMARTRQAEKARMEVQKRGVGEKSRVKVRLRDKTEVKGYISQIDATSFQVTDKKTGRVSTIGYDTVEKIRGGGLPKGANIAIGIGVGVAVALTAFALVVASWHGN
jgi:hypothetical protein